MWLGWQLTPVARGSMLPAPYSEGNMRTREDNMGIRQMATLLRAGYPLSDLLRTAIAELVAAAAVAARRSRAPSAPPRKGKKP